MDQLAFRPTQPCEREHPDDPLTAQDCIMVVVRMEEARRYRHKKVEVDDDVMRYELPNQKLRPAPISALKREIIKFAQP